MPRLMWELALKRIQSKKKQIEEERMDEMIGDKTIEESKDKEYPTNVIDVKSEQSDEHPVETKSEENTASSSILKNDVTGTDENENMKQDDINVLNTNVTSELEKDDTTDSNPGVREHFVNYFGKTCKNCNAVLKQKGKSILPLFELCRLFLGLNNDTCSAMSSSTKSTYSKNHDHLNIVTLPFHSKKTYKFNWINTLKFTFYVLFYIISHWSTKINYRISLMTFFFFFS